MLREHNESTVEADLLPLDVSIRGLLVAPLERRSTVELPLLTKPTFTEHAVLQFVSEMGEFGVLPHEEVYWREKETYLLLGRQNWPSLVCAPVGVTEVFFPVCVGLERVRFVSFDLPLYM